MTMYYPKTLLCVVDHTVTLIHPPNKVMVNVKLSPDQWQAIQELIRECANPDHVDNPMLESMPWEEGMPRIVANEPACLEFGGICFEPSWVRRYPAGGAMHWDAIRVGQSGAEDDEPPYTNSGVELPIADARALFGVASISRQARNLIPWRLGTHTIG